MPRMNPAVQVLEEQAQALQEPTQLEVKAA